MTVHSDYNLEGIEKYLRDNFKKAELGVVNKILGESAEYQHQIIKVEEYKHKDLFSNYHLLWVHVKEPYLDKANLPSSQSYGLFASNDIKCLYLVNTQELSELLRTEINLETISPAILADLFCDSCIHCKKNWQMRIDNFSEIEKIAQKSNGYHIREEIIIPNAKLIKTDDKYLLKFFTLESWLQKNNKINEVLIEIEEDFKFTIKIETYYKTIFSQVPIVMY